MTPLLAILRADAS